MRDTFKKAGCTVLTKEAIGVTNGLGIDLSNKEVVAKDWAENVFGCPWDKIKDRELCDTYCFRTGFNYEIYHITPLDKDVVYGEINGVGYLFNVRELKLD